MEVPQAAIDLAKRFEGFERKAKRGIEITAVPYICPAGYWTIGYGHLCDPKHPPITEAEAEVLLGALENSSRSNSRRTRADYLLSGILKSPDGSAWHSDGEGFYRVGKGKRVKAATIEAAVLSQLAENLQADNFVAAFTAAATVCIWCADSTAQGPAIRQKSAPTRTSPTPPCRCPTPCR